MRRLPPNKRDTAKTLLADTPENCSALFLFNLDTSVVIVDNEHTPKFLAITYPDTSPALYFLYGQSDQLIMVKRFLKQLKLPADLVVPHTLFPAINRYWAIRFAIPVLLLSAPEEGWTPKASQDFRVRLLKPDDAEILKKAFSSEDWLWDFFSTPQQLLSKGQAVAAFIEGAIACVSTTLAFTEKYCELGVATRPEYQGRGLALECARTLSKIQFEQFGRLPCWRTHTGNIGSWKVAQRLGLKEIQTNEEFIFLSNYEHVGSYAGVAP
ncbi:MAG TPA: hypothetical protein DDZ91_04215 [Firmicutes bacterium]|jgi:RimJ/RimL family protein N-acetyltransferase|nr:hypothetical protein [Bacillota bacterium]